MATLRNREHRRQGTVGSIGTRGEPRDRTYRRYLVRENPWLQLQGWQHVCLNARSHKSRLRRPTQCPLCPDSGQGRPQRSEMTRWAKRRHQSPR